MKFRDLEVEHGLPRPQRLGYGERNRKERVSTLESMFQHRLTVLAASFCLCLSACTPSPQRIETQPGQQATVSDSEVKIVVARTESREIAPVIHCTGQIKPDFGKECVVSIRLNARVLKVLTKPGEQVSRGQILGYLDSQQISEIEAQAIEVAARLNIAQAHEEREREVYQEERLRPKSLIRAKAVADRAKLALQAANRDLERLTQLYKERIVAQKDYLTAQTAKEKASLDLQQAELEEKREQELFANDGLIKKDWQISHAETERCRNELSVLTARLKFLGVDTNVVGDAIAKRELQPLIPIVAPSGGTIVQQFVAPGEIIQADEPIFSLCDMKNVAISCELPEADLDQIKAGLPVTARVKAYGGHAFSGNIVYVGSKVDSKTRTTPVRALLANDEGRLKLNMFASVDIQGQPRKVTVCPKEAVHESAGKMVVYVRSPRGKFSERVVQTGITSGDWIEVVNGLRDGEEVVTDGGVLVKTELLIGTL